MKLFKYKHEKIINNFQRKAFAAWEIPIDDIASEFRFKAVLAVYVSIFLSGSIEDKTTVEKISQSIFMKIRETVVNKRCRVSDVFIIEKEVKLVNLSQSKFLEEVHSHHPRIKVDEDTCMNGHAIVNNLTHVIAEDCLLFLQEKTPEFFISSGMLLLRDVTSGGFEGANIISEMQLSEDFTIFLVKMLKIIK